VSFPSPLEFFMKKVFKHAAIAVALASVIGSA